MSEIAPCAPERPVAPGRRRKNPALLPPSSPRHFRIPSFITAQLQVSPDERVHVHVHVHVHPRPPSMPSPGKEEEELKEREKPQAQPQAKEQQQQQQPQDQPKAKDREQPQEQEQQEQDQEQEQEQHQHQQQQQQEEQELLSGSDEVDLSGFDFEPLSVFADPADPYPAAEGAGGGIGPGPFLPLPPLPRAASPGSLSGDPYLLRILSRLGEEEDDGDWAGDFRDGEGDLGSDSDGGGILAGSSFDDGSYGPDGYGVDDGSYGSDGYGNGDRYGLGGGEGNLDDADLLAGLIEELALGAQTGFTGGPAAPPLTCLPCDPRDAETVGGTLPDQQSLAELLLGPGGGGGGPIGDGDLEALAGLIEELDLGAKTGFTGASAAPPLTCIPCTPVEDQSEAEAEAEADPSTEEEPELKSEDERHERRKQLLQLSALGRNPLGLIAEDGWGEGDEGGSRDSGDGPGGDGGTDGDGPAPVNRLAYDLDQQKLDLSVLDQLTDQIPGLKEKRDAFEEALLGRLLSEHEEGEEGRQGGVIDLTEDLAGIVENDQDRDESEGEGENEDEGGADSAALPLTCIPCRDHQDDGEDGTMEAEQELPRGGWPSAHRPAFANRPAATDALLPILGADMKERSCIGHRETIFGVSLSPCGRYLATASQDSSVRIWDVRTHRGVGTLEGHSKSAEVLRVAWASSSWGGPQLGRKAGDLVLATAGADGFVRLWHKEDGGSWTCLAKKDHSPEKPEEDGEDAPEEGEEGAEDAVAQIYALQFIDGFGTVGAGENVLLTCSDDYTHILSASAEEKKGEGGKGLPAVDLTELMTVRFTQVERSNGGVSYRIGDIWFEASNDTAAELDEETQEGFKFGGDRNPNNLVYVFDVAYSETSRLLAAALSDGTVRLVNTRGVCASVLSLPGNSSYLTSATWDSSGTRLACCVATGHVILWNILDGGGGHVHCTCTAVLGGGSGGGHEVGKTLFGAKYFGGKDEELLLSWGIDGKVCQWDSHCRGEIGDPLAVLISKDDYPIFAVDVDEPKEGPVICRIAVGGGKQNGEKLEGLGFGFLGVSVYVYDFTARNAEAEIAVDESKSSSR